MNGEMTRRGKTIRIALVTAAAAAFTTVGAACSSDRKDDTIYCVDQNNRVVEDRYCDDDYCVDDYYQRPGGLSSPGPLTPARRDCDDGHGRTTSHAGSGGYYLWHRSGRHHYSLGSVVSGGERIGLNDTSARSRVGLSPSGPITSGTISRGGIGHGSDGSSGG